MNKYTQKQSLKKTDLKSILFDALMVHINPDLMIENRKQTAEYLSRLTNEERNWELKSYEQAYAIFLENWPDFVERAMSELSELIDDLRAQGAEIDIKKLQNIEHQFEDFPDA